MIRIYCTQQTKNKLIAEDRPRSFNAPQQHLYNGLARPEDCSMFAREWTRRLRASPYWHRNRLARTDRVPAYGHRAYGQHGCSRPGQYAAGELMLSRDRHQYVQRDGQGET